MLGLLHACDWAGSARRSPLAPLNYGEHHLVDHMRTKVPAFTDWHDFQKRSGEATGNVIAIAPTGSGKTEAALLWAANRPAGARIIYCLPTKVTSNAIFRRIEGIFPAPSQEAATVGVVHSGAKHYRVIDDKEEYDERNYLADKSFGREITVCTIDQLLTMGFNLGHWQLKTLYASKAAIIIDEIHLYEPYTLALIINTINFLQEHCGATFYIMTATLPDKLRLLLNETLKGKITEIIDTQKAEQARNTWEYIDEFIEDDMLRQRVEADIEAGNKVLIVRNTVDDCIATYQRFSKHVRDATRRCCLHSRFTTIDRLAKEEVVVDLKKGEPFLLVSTQVVEVSLDIDFDILYTENAPIDAIVQRAGRVNRKGKKSPAETRVVVFKASENSRRMYGKEIEDILDRTANQLRQRQGQRVREADMVTMVNEVYTNYEVTQTEGYRTGRIRYAEVQKHFDYVLDNDQSIEEKAVTREGIDTVAVIPICYQDILRGSNLSEKTRYQIPIRPDQLARLPNTVSDEDYDFIKYVDTPYSTETGLHIPSWKEINDSHGTSKAEFPS